MKFDEIHLGIISAKRPDNVKKTIKFLGGLEHTWYVAKGDAESYKNAGAINVIESGKLCESRNTILDDAFKDNKTCVELSDDLVSLKFAYSKIETKNIDTIHPFIEYMLGHLDNSNLKLAGINPTANAFYFNPLMPIKTTHFIIGDFIVIKPTTLRFDEEFKTKEDYDYTLQHIELYGGVIRCDELLCKFNHYTNKGGVVDIRTPQVEQESINRLKNKWGNIIKNNPKRVNEILLNHTLLKK